MTRRLRIIFVGLFFALTFVCSAASIYLVFATSLMASYPGWGATPKNGRLIVFKEEEYAARLSALHEGDEVIAFNGQPVKTVAPINKYFSTAELGDYNLTVRRDDGAVQELTLQTLPLPYTTRIGAVISIILVPCLFLLIGFALFVLKPFDKQGLLLALLFAMYAATHSGGFSIAPVWLKVLMAVNVCVAFCAPALFLHFTLVFPEPSPLVRRFPRLEWILYAPPLIFFVPIQLFVYGVYFLAPKRYEAARFANIGKASTIVWMLYIGAGICFLINTYRLANQLSRRKLRVVLAGTLAAFAPGMLLYIAAQFVEPSKLKRTIGAWPSLIATASILLLPLSFAYAILRHKVIPVSLIIRRSARYLLVSRGSILLEALAVGLVLAFLMNEFFRYHAWSGSTVGIISAVVSVIVWQFTTVFNKRFIAPVIDRRFFREAYNAQAILADLMRMMRSVTDTQQLLELVVSRIQAALHAQNVNVFLQRGSSGDYVCALSSEYLEGAHRSTLPTNEKDVLADDGFVAQILRETSAPLAVDFTDPNSWLANAPPTKQTDGAAIIAVTAATTSRADVETLRRIDSALLLPLATKNQLVGFVSLGARLGDLPCSAANEQLLMSVAGQITLALENARLVEGMLEEGRRRQKVEAENARRAEELEEARGLQLSMLPKTVPQVPGLEIAAYMKPATEVGGDYYDFHVGDDGTLTIAVGDATGHGLKAGTMVTATKGSFNAFAGDQNIPQIFKDTSRALKKMNLRGLYMAMTMLKITNRHLVVSAAGMPSTLIYRAATQQVEEVSIRAMPLGSVANFAYQQQEHALSTGDAVMMMSDGFPEMFNEAGEMLDYGKAKTLLKEIARDSPQEIINRFVEVGEQWAGTRAPDDDVTFVVLKVKDGNAAGNGAHAAA